MTDPRAKLAYLSQPQPGKTVLTVKTEHDIFLRVELSEAQRRNLVADGAKFAPAEYAEARFT
jgi:hypothetical protein